MIKVSSDATDTMRRVTAMTRPDPSNPLRRELITEDYLEAQAQDQLNYYTVYRYISDVVHYFYSDEW